MAKEDFQNDQKGVQNDLLVRHSEGAPGDRRILNLCDHNRYNHNMSKQAYVYIMTNKSNTVLYTGVTSNLIKRVYEHKQKLVDGFTKKYNVTKLVYFEVFEDIENAITREKQIKGWLRNKKVILIESMNPEWEDLSEGLF